MLKYVLFLAFLLFLASSTEGGGDRSDDVAGELEGFGCQSIEKFTDLLKLIGAALKLYKARFGILYKGLKEVQAKDIKECVDNCGSNEKCFVLSWTEDKKCHLQQDGNGVLKRGNFEPKENALTLLGKPKHLQRFRISGSYGGGYDEKSDDKDDVAAKFKGFGCKNSRKCLDLVGRSGFVHSLWRIKYGYQYKGSKEVPSKDIKECLDKCKNSDKCFVFSWTNDQKCLVQDDGETDLNPDNLEKAKGTITFLGKINKLLRLRKFGNESDYEEEPEYDDDGVTGGGGVTSSGEVTGGGGVTGGGEVTSGGGGGVTGGGVVTSGGGGVTGGGVVTSGGGVTGGGGGVTASGQTGSQLQTQPVFCSLTLQDANYVDPNMVSVAGPSSVSECQNYCKLKAECKAASFRTDQTCWVLNSSEFGTMDNVQDDPGVATYLKEQC